MAINQSDQSHKIAGRAACRSSICTCSLWLMTSTSTSVGSATPTPFVVSIDSKGNISMLIELNVISLLATLLFVALTLYWCPWSKLLSTFNAGSTEELVGTDELVEDEPQAEELQAENEPQAVQAAPAPAPPPPQQITVPPPSVFVSRVGRVYHITRHSGSLFNVPVTELPACRRCTV